MVVRTQAEPKVEVEVEQRIIVRLRRDVVEHALRCHLANVLVQQHRLPVLPTLHMVEVKLFVNDDGMLLSAELSYIAQPNAPVTVDE